MVGRGCGTIGLYYLLRLCGYEKNAENPLTLKELIFIWYAGMIRGAIAFGLVLRVDSFFPNKDVIVTTCLALVVLTTIVCGSTVGLLSACLFVKEDNDNFTAADGCIIDDPQQRFVSNPPFDTTKSVDNHSMSTNHKTKGFVWAKSSCRRFEAGNLRDFFIYKHSVERRAQMKKWLEEEHIANDREEVFKCCHEHHEHLLHCPTKNEEDLAAELEALN